MGWYPEPVLLILAKKSFASTKTKKKLRRCGVGSASPNLKAGIFGDPHQLHAKDQQMRGGLSRKLASGAAQSNKMCENL